jgi:hypothetical protein
MSSNYELPLRAYAAALGLLIIQLPTSDHIHTVVITAKDQQHVIT